MTKIKTWLGNFAEDHPLATSSVVTMAETVAVYLVSVVFWTTTYVAIGYPRTIPDAAVLVWATVAGYYAVQTTLYRAKERSESESER